MSDMKQLSHMSQFSIIREIPGGGEMIHPIKKVKTNNNKPAELKFKIEPVGMQPEDDDDLEMCPSRTRSNWPHQIIPWWKPTYKSEKPPYSYATLIAHAILTSKDGRLTLNDIYKWISENYPFYKLGQKGWQNSIRHNLSLNKKWFIKVDRRPTQAHPGKGGYWTLQEKMEKIFVDNLCQSGGHSRRHSDMNMYSIYPQQYKPNAKRSDQDLADSQNMPCPNIHITRPEDFESNNIKKHKQSTNNNSIPIPRIRNMPSKSTVLAEQENTYIPNTDGKQLTIRFNNSDPQGNKRKKSFSSSTRPPPKKGKKRNYVEPGSSTNECDEDSAIDVDSFETSKKRKSKQNVDTISSSPQVSQITKPSDLIDLLENWVFDNNNNESNLLLTTGYSPMMMYTEEQQQETELLLNALTSVVGVEEKKIDLQDLSLSKSLHYSHDFSLDEFSNPDSKLYISDINNYHLEQFIDFKNEQLIDFKNEQPSDILNNDPILDIYWPEPIQEDCFMNFDMDKTNTMLI